MRLNCAEPTVADDTTTTCWCVHCGGLLIHETCWDCFADRRAFRVLDDSRRRG
jgi:hypothetical protein